MNLKRITALFTLAKDTFKEVIIEKKGLASTYYFTNKLATKIDSLEEKYSTEELLLAGEFYEFMLNKSQDTDKESRWE